jgi:regulation of enolase protein 1 (concanavalin A-like superfamily)
LNEALLHEAFRATALDARLAWFNPPQLWRLDSRGPRLVVEPDGQTDFWQRTHYGFCADNGHFLGLELRGDFILSTEVQFHPVHQYDQAGLLIRGDANCWIKASVEHELEGRPQLGTVVTNHGYSDWSLQDFPFSESTLCLRITKHGADVLVEFSPAGGGPWQLMRVARLHWPDAVPVRAGLYACSPKAAGFRAEFTFLRIEFSPTSNPKP